MAWGTWTVEKGKLRSIKGGRANEKAGPHGRKQQNVSGGRGGKPVRGVGGSEVLGNTSSPGSGKRALFQYS